MWKGYLQQAQQTTISTETVSTETVSAEFDWQQLSQLAGGDPDFEAELLAMFLGDAEESLRQLEYAIATKSIKNIESLAHSLRGASANVGACALATVASQLEQTARKGKMTDACKLLRQLNIHRQRIQIQLQR
ncbi:MAG: Hpt domain-containing protein [Phormidesmis sp.]